MANDMTIDEITLQFTASAGNVSNTFAALEKRLARIATAFDKIDTSKVDRICDAFERMSNSITSDTDRAARGLSSLLGKMSQLDSSATTNATHALDALGNSLRAFPTINPEQAKGLSSVAAALNSFSRIKQMGDIGDVRAFSTNIRELMVSMEGLDISRIQPVAEAISKFAQGINILGRTKVDKAITNLPLLAKEMENLMNSLARAPTVSDNVVRLTEAIAHLASQGQKVGSATAGMNRILNNTNSAGRNGAKGLDIFSRSASAQKAHVKSLASIVGGLIAKYWILWRAVQMMGDMAGVASSLVEVQNVVDHTFGQMSYKLDEFTKDSIDNFGLSTLAAKQYASRFQSMGMAMGITNNQVAQSADFVSAHMNDEAKALYNTSDSLADMSINLTKLAADYASFYDVDPAETFEKFQTVLTGQTRPLRAYGLDLTQATLSEWALKNGLDADMQSMTQAEKAMLRYQYVMAQSSHITSDFARTSETYHNTLTKLKANFQTLKGTIGTSLMNLFKPIMVVVNNAIVVINQFAKAVGDSLGKILGWRYEVGNGAVALEDTADYMDDVGSSAGGASKAAKELKRQLQGFDELNLLTTDPDNGRGGGGSGGSGLGGAGGASNLAGQWVKDEGLFESDWDTWFKLGRGISEAWTAGLNSIDWDKVYEGARGFGTGLAQFLNGLITPDLFGALGKTIAGALNTAVYTALAFGETLDWKQMGDALSSSINSFFETFDWESAGKAMHSIQSGVLTMLITAIDKVDWYKVGESIGTFLENLDIPDLIAKLGELAVKIAGALYDALCGLWDNTSWQTKFGIAILGFLKLAKLTGLGGILSTTIGSQMPGSINIAKAVGVAITVAFTFQAGGKIGSTIGALLAEYVMDDPELADEYIAYGNMSLGEKFNYFKDSFADWDSSDMFSLFGTTSTKLQRMVEYAQNGELYGGILDEFREMKDEMSGLTFGDISGFENYQKLPQSLKKSFGKALQESNAFFKQFTTLREKFLQKQSENTDDYTAGVGSAWDAMRDKILGTENEMSSGVTTSANETQRSTSSSYSTMGTNVLNTLIGMSNNNTTFFGLIKQVATAQTEEERQNVASKYVNMSKVTGDETTKMYNSVNTNTTNSKNTFIQNLKSMKQENDTQSKNIILTVQNWTTNMKQLVSGTKANASFGVTTTPKKTVQDAINDLKSVWTNKDVNFTVNPRATSIQDIINANAERHNQWYDKTSNLWMNPNATPKQTIVDAYNDLTSGWTDKSANLSIGMSIDSVSGSISDIKAAAAEKFNEGVTNLETILRNKKVITHNEKLPRIYAATGAIVDKATLAMIGEDGTEAVMPLENNTQWLGKMANMLVTEMGYSAPSYSGGSYTAHTNGARSEQDLAEQNALLREQNRLLQMIADKEVTISSSDVFNATKSEGENYYNRTGNSPFIF